MVTPRHPAATDALPRLLEQRRDGAMAQPLARARQTRGAGERITYTAYGSSLGDFCRGLDIVPAHTQHWRTYEASRCPCGTCQPRLHFPTGPATMDASMLLDNGDSFYYPRLDGEQFSYLSAGVTFTVGQRFRLGFGVTQYEEAARDANRVELRFGIGY